METILEKIMHVGIVSGVASANCHGCQHMHKTKSITYVHNLGLQTQCLSYVSLLQVQSGILHANPQLIVA
jgi:hypothetical protein